MLEGVGGRDANALGGGRFDIGDKPREVLPGRRLGVIGDARIVESAVAAAAIEPETGSAAMFVSLINACFSRQSHNRRDNAGGRNTGNKQK